jgi:NAD(P)-dependent dehydrogenase (short-subunit alcohol dehydrogenase family)
MDPIMSEKIIVVTGVSSGIGFSVTEKFIKEGWTVFGSVRSESDGNRLQRQFGHNYKPLIIDVTQQQTIVQSVRLVEEYLEGRTLALLVNNAGVAISGPMEHITEEEMRYQLDVNVIGCMLVTQLYLPLLKSKDGLNSGKIIHISSVSGIFTTPFMGPYAASKHALEAMNDAWRRELSFYGIQVFNIQPGPIKTEIWRKAKEESKSYPTGVYDSFLKNRNAIIDKRATGALNPKIIADKVWNITNNKHSSRFHFLISRNKWIFLLLKVLPTIWADKLIMRQLKNA